MLELVSQHKFMNSLPVFFTRLVNFYVSAVLSSNVSDFSDMFVILIIIMYCISFWSLYNLTSVVDGGPWLSQNSAVLAYHIVWRKIPQYWPKLAMAESPKLPPIATMAPPWLLFDNIKFDKSWICFTGMDYGTVG
jgi:hypothetical protein